MGYINNGSLSFSHLHPFGLLVTSNITTSLNSIHVDQIKEWLFNYKLVVFRNFELYTPSQLLQYAQSLGDLLEWQSGPIMEMKVDESKKNYLFTHLSVPFHWDGAFHEVPKYLFFNCIKAPSTGAGGETIFSDTEQLYNALPSDLKKYCESLTLEYETEKLAHYGGKISEKMIQQHPDKHCQIIRFAETVPDSYPNPVKVNLQCEVNEQATSIIQQISSMLYESRFCYTHQWQANDFVIADNYSLVHGRHAFKQFSPRHLRRIQLLNFSGTKS